MISNIPQKAAHLAELCHGQTVEAATEYITGFLRALGADEDRRTAKIRESLAEFERYPLGELREIQDRAQKALEASR